MLCHQLARFAVFKQFVGVRFDTSYRYFAVSIAYVFNFLFGKVQRLDDNGNLFLRQRCFGNGLHVFYNIGNGSDTVRTPRVHFVHHAVVHCCGMFQSVQCVIGCVDAVQRFGCKFVVHLACCGFCLLVGSGGKFRNVFACRSQHCHQLLCVKFDGCFQRYLSCFGCRHRQTELRKTEVLNYFVVGILCLEFFQTALQRIGKFAVGNNCDARLCRLFRYCRFNFSRQFVGDKFATPRRYAYMYGFAVKQIVEFRRLTGDLCNDVLHVFATMPYSKTCPSSLEP